MAFSLSREDAAPDLKVRFRSTLALKMALIYFAFGAAILAVVGMLAFQSGRRALETATIGRLNAEAIEKEAELRSWIDRQTSDIEALSHSPSLAQELSALLSASPGSPEAAAARDRLITLPGIWVTTGRKFVSMSVIEAESGRIVAATSPDDVGKFNEDRPYFINGKLGPFVQDPTYSVQLRGPSIAFSAPIRSGKSVIGVLVGFGDMSQMQTIAARRSSEERTNDNYIVNDAGLYVTQPRYIADPASLRFGARSAFVDDCLRGNSGSTLAEDYRGTPVVAVYRRIPEYEFCLITKIDQAEALQPIGAFRDQMWLIAAVTLALALVVAAGLARTITGPVRALQATAARVGKGEFGTRLPERRNDELGLLAREFNRMAGSIADTQKQLRHQADELRTANEELAESNARMGREIIVRQQAERRASAQLERLSLLHHITRAIGERQDLGSIFQVVVRSVEEQLPVDFACLCLYDKVDHVLTVTRIGVKSGAFALELAMSETARIDIDENGLSRCVRGELVYEPDVETLDFPFPQRLARGGLGALVAAPLQIEDSVFGALIVARIRSGSFSSGECEFLRQLSEHVALATHQANLYGTLNRAYDDLRQTQQAVMQQERLRTLGQMASGIAHDINNALSPAVLYTETLLETDNLSAEARGYLEIILRSVDDISQTVARLREFYRHQDPQTSHAPVDMNTVVRQVVDLTRARWSDMPLQRGIVVRVETATVDGLPAVAGAESELREALVNLVLNAVDALPGGGTVTIRTATRRIAGQPDPAVMVEVTDTGLGMDEETRRRCLEPFFTTKGERGTGLGLAMVYGIVQRHSAEIEIESEVGRGTTVRLILPTPRLVSATAPQPLRKAPERLRLLLIDDDPLLLRSLRDSLEKEGHKVTTASGGQEGLDAFRAAHETGEDFALVVTDLGMPNVDGRRVAAGIKGIAPSMPVILLTGWGHRLQLDREMPAHVDRVLSKPPRLRELRDAFAELLGEA